VRIAAAAGTGALAAILAFVYWRRRRHATAGRSDA
jgi:LPXTG-motif cell wall-anchored protein